MQKHWKFAIKELYNGFQVKKTVEKLQKFIPDITVDDIVRYHCNKSFYSDSYFSATFPRKTFMYLFIPFAKINRREACSISCLLQWLTGGGMQYLFFIKHYLFSVLVSHILQTKIFFNKVKINIPRKIDYLHRVAAFVFKWPIGGYVVAFTNDQQVEGVRCSQVLQGATRQEKDMR